MHDNGPKMFSPIFPQKLYTACSNHVETWVWQNLSKSRIVSFDTYTLVTSLCKNSPRHWGYRPKFGRLLTEIAKRLKSTNGQSEVDIPKGGDYFYKKRLLMQLSSHFSTADESADQPVRHHECHIPERVDISSMSTAKWIK